MGLESFFRPKSVVLVGATDKSPWSQLIHGNFAKMGYAGGVHLVNRRGAAAHGLPASTSCSALAGNPPDIAYVFVPTDAVADALADVASAGIRNALVLSSGYGETGAEGAAAQDALVRDARARGLRLLGPNSLGFINYIDATPVTPFPVVEGWRSGAVAVVSQSGATTQVIAGFAQQQGVGLSYAIATGNEADISAAEVIAFLADDPATRVVTLFAEAINDPAAFRAAARRCAGAGKPLVVMKVGRTALAQQLAQAHTGSVAGDDRVFDAVCAQDNVIRVGSLEELVTTAGVLARTGPIAGGAAIISISGGACEIIADAADLHGLDLPAFAPATVAALEQVVSAYGSTFNPLDVTGAAVRDPAMFETLLGIVARDPAIGLVGCVYDLTDRAGDYIDRASLTRIGAGLSAAGKPAFLLNQALRPLGEWARTLMAEAGIPAATGGLDLAVRAFAAAQRWSAARARAARTVAVAPASGATPMAGTRPASEREALDFLQRQGIDTPPRVLALTAGEAIEAWRTMDGPVVLKIASPAIRHKSDIGGVRLDLDDADAIGAAFDAIMAAARAACPDAAIDGCLVMPMRRGGLELFVGTARTAWGPAIVAGLGGIWIEALADTSLRLLPIDHGDALEMLGGLRGARLLRGYRGRPAVDLDAVAAAIRGIGDAALALGPDLVSLEVNPLLADDHRVEALDALAIWDGDG